MRRGSAGLQHKSAPVNWFSVFSQIDLAAFQENRWQFRLASWLAVTFASLAWATLICAAQPTSLSCTTNTSCLWYRCKCMYENVKKLYNTLQASVANSRPKKFWHPRYFWCPSAVAMHISILKMSLNTQAFIPRMYVLSSMLMIHFTNHNCLSGLLLCCLQVLESSLLLNTNVYCFCQFNWRSCFWQQTLEWAIMLSDSSVGQSKQFEVGRYAYLNPFARHLFQ